VKNVWQSSDHHMLPAPLPGVRSNKNLAFDSRLSITVIELCKPSTRC
jgi:hypothetical protein